MASKDSDGIPPSISLNNPEISYDVWVLWMATGRRFLPSQLLNEPSSLLNDVLQLDGLYHAITKVKDGDDD